jgi:hypothetical protein
VKKSTTKGGNKMNKRISAGLIMAMAMFAEAFRSKTWDVPSGHRGGYPIPNSRKIRNKNKRRKS